jgi:hypothetical protein
MVPTYAQIRPKMIPTTKYQNERFSLYLLKAYQFAIKFHYKLRKLLGQLLNSFMTLFLSINYSPKTPMVSECATVTSILTLFHISKKLFGSIFESALISLTVIICQVIFKQLVDFLNSIIKSVLVSLFGILKLDPTFCKNQFGLNL